MTPPGWKCPRRIGFLFPHPCSRLTPEGCPDCQNGQIADPYIRRTDRYYYSDYDFYDDSLTALAIEGAIHADHHFTEADGESLVMPEDSYEDDLTAS
jgi:hypothetical protein